MPTSSKTIYGVLSLSSLLAILFAFFPSPKVHAQQTCSGCLYAGNCFSTGACISSPSGGQQQCDGGHWFAGCN